MLVVAIDAESLNSRTISRTARVEHRYRKFTANSLVTQSDDESFTAIVRGRSCALGTSHTYLTPDAAGPCRVTSQDAAKVIIRKAMSSRTCIYSLGEKQRI